MTPSNHKGLLLAMIVLVILAVVCQLTNYFDSKSNMSHLNKCKCGNPNCKCRNPNCKNCEQVKLDTFFDTGNSSSVFRPYKQTEQEMNQMNQIKYLNLNNCKTAPCTAIQETSHAKIPCSLYQECLNSNGDSQQSNPYQYTEQDIKTLMLSAYHEIGKEAANRYI